MKKITASEAKQNFGDLLDSVARGPIGIERHKKIKAIVCTPEAFLGAAVPDAEYSIEARLAARAEQRLVDQARLIKHQRIALELVLISPEEQMHAIGQARAEVQRWRDNSLCNEEYASQWERLLAMPVAQLAKQMVSESSTWGKALLQNSPWHVVVFRGLFSDEKVEIFEPKALA